MNFRKVLSRYLGNREITRENGKKLVETFNSHLAQNFFRGRSILDLAEDRCFFIDHLLCMLYRQFGLDACPDIAIIAVGGYGRKELHPFTDIDMLILSQRPLSPEFGEKTGAFITLLWDLKLDVGHAVRTVDECATAGLEDLTIATNLMEKRLICGSEETYDLLQKATDPRVFWPIEKFFRAKMEEQEKRHRLYKNTIYLLEPDLKNMCGGLRDVQTIMWIARKFSGAATPAEIQSQGFLTASENRDLFFNAYFIWKVRFALQFISRRNDNRLTFDRQVTVARSLGYIGSGNVPVENMMIRFYRASQCIEEINQMILKMYEEAIFKTRQHGENRIVNSRFVLRGNAIDVVDPDLFIREPEAIMEMMDVVSRFSAQKDGLEIAGLYPNCVRSIREARLKFSGRLEDSSVCREYFLKIMSNPEGMLLPLKLMIRHGVMAMYMPEWIRLTGLMQFDMFHTYTVDEHTYRAVANVYEFSHSPDIDPSKNLFRDICRNLPRKHLLYLAALMHDIGKGRQGGHHALVGAEITQKFFQLHGLPQSEVRLLTWLVKHHIDFSNTAQRRDISDPIVISDFAAMVQDEAHLDYLYCLSVADICATSDSAWNSWKDALFKELYYAARRALRQDPERRSDERALTVEENKTAAMKLLAAAGFDAEAVAGLWRTFPESYFIRHNQAQICHHSMHILNHHQDLPLVVFGESVNHLGTELFIYMKDRLGIFARIVSILLAKQISIMSASILSSTDGYIMDSFTILDRAGAPISPEKNGPLKKFMMMNLIGNDFAAPPGCSIPRKYLQFKIKTVVQYLDIPGSEKHGVTHMEVSALDRPGLLACIASTLENLGINIRAARIATTGERADDGFTISLDGRALNDRTKEKLREKLTAAIECQNDDTQAGGSKDRKE